MSSPLVIPRPNRGTAPGVRRAPSTWQNLGKLESTTLIKLKMLLPTARNSTTLNERCRPPWRGAHRSMPSGSRWPAASAARSSPRERDLDLSGGVSQLSLLPVRESGSCYGNSFGYSFVERKSATVCLCSLQTHARTSRETCAVALRNLSARAS